MIPSQSEVLKELEEFIAASAEPYLHPSRIEQLTELLRETARKFPVTRSTENNFRRIIGNVLDKSFFFNGLITYDYAREVIFAAAAHSNYLTDIVVRNPEYLSWILELVPLQSPINGNTLLEEVASAFNRFKNFDTKVRRLKAIKRREILRIGLRDILGFSDVKNVTLELSLLARVIAGRLFTLCVEEASAKNRIEDSLPEYCLVALGKFGGLELNYSSDIDLILFFDENKLLDGRRESYEIFSEAIHLFINSASLPDESGFLYRVDFRLRPDGRTSPLCRTLTDYLSYYESRGEHWERQMLIKAGLVTGSRNLFETFLKKISPFIYPASFNVSPAVQIKKIRNNILARQGAETNIKLSKGGIRDIEFSVQVLQMLNGGSAPDLKTGNTLEAIERLKSASLLTKDEAETFTSSYIHYRKIEHYLQLMNDRQTHTIPEDPDLLFKLGHFAGARDTDDFLRNLDFRKTRVHEIYNSIIGGSADEAFTDPLSAVNFSDRKKAEKSILYLREGRGLLDQKIFDSRTISLFKEIEMQLFEFLRSSSAPDVVLDNFVRVIRAGELPSVFYDVFRDQSVFDSFLVCCERNQKFINLFSQDKILMEEILSGNIFLQPDEAFPDYSYSQISAKTAALLSIGIIKQKEAAEIISRYCKTAIVNAVTDTFSEKEPFVFTVIALGSCANNQMNFSSDIDLIFITGDENLPENIQKIFVGLLGRARDYCYPLKVDCRLRPEGQSSPIVWSIDGYTKYLRTRARIWEFQSLTKISFIAGSDGLYQKFIESVVGALSNFSREFVAGEVLQMRKKYLAQSSVARELNIKKSRGGIGDIEFMIQFFILTNSDYFKNLAGKNTYDALSLLADSEKIAKEDAVELGENYRLLREAEMGAQIIYDISTSPGKEKLNSDLLKTHLKIFGTEPLYDILRKSLLRNAEIIANYLTDYN